MPANAAEADKIIKPKAMIFAAVVFLTLAVGTILGVLLPIWMHKSPNSWPAFVVDIATVALFMGMYYRGSAHLVRTLLGFGRNFVEKGQWADAEEMLGSFNQWGQNFLDTTGEGHYLLSVALAKRGKPEGARKAREWVARSRPNSEWASKLAGQGEPVSAARIAASRPQEKPPRPQKGRRRRY
jgi:hypothetical protein